MKNINQTEWQELIVKDKNAIIIDARTPRECEEGVIEKAIMIDFLDTPKFKTEIKKLDKNKNYYVYCRSGNRSAKACQLLNKLGIDVTFNLIGGMMTWNGPKVIPA